MTRREKIFFHGSGLVTALGDSVEANLAALANSKGDAANRPAKIALSYMGNTEQIPYHTISSPSLAEGEERIYQIIDKVVEQALDKTDISTQAVARMGLFVGSTSFDIYTGEQRIKNSDLSDESISRHIPPFADLSRYIATKHHIRGPVYTINTACTSSANALMYAAEFIRRGDIDEALVVGLEFFNEMTALGFRGLELISPTTMRPFRDDRNGLVLGEGCSAIVLSKKPAAHNFGYVSAANLSDNFSITACNSDGSTVAAVIQQALADADLTAEDIAIVKAHGTASLSNDEAEARGLRQVFSTVPPVVVLKPSLGHTLGACGTNELILFYEGIIRQQLPIVDKQDPASDSFGLKLFGETDQHVDGHFLLNYFGFGGNNTAVIISNV